MLEQLAHLSKELVASRAVVGKIGHGVIVVYAAIVRQTRDIGHVLVQGVLLLVRELVDLLPSVVGTATPRTVSTFHVLNSARTRS